MFALAADIVFEADFDPRRPERFRALAISGRLRRYIGFCFLNSATGRINYGYAHLQTGAIACDCCGVSGEQIPGNDRRLRIQSPTRFHRDAMAIGDAQCHPFQSQ